MTGALGDLLVAALAADALARGAALAHGTPAVCGDHRACLHRCAPAPALCLSLCLSLSLSLQPARSGARPLVAARPAPVPSCVWGDAAGRRPRCPGRAGGRWQPEVAAHSPLFQTSFSYALCPAPHATLAAFAALAARAASGAGAPAPRFAAAACVRPAASCEVAAALGLRAVRPALPPAPRRARLGAASRPWRIPEQPASGLTAAAAGCAG